MKDPLHDAGTPEEEAMRYRVIPLLWRLPKLKQNWFHTCSYNDHPEGEDLAGKLVALNRTVVPYVTAWGVVDALMFTCQPTAQLRIGRILYFMWPAVACSTVYATTTYVATNIRKKDDFWNSALGAFAAGGVIGQWKGKGLWGWHAAFIFTIAAGLQRVAKHEGWEFFHEFDNSGDHVTDAESHRWHKYSKGWELFKDPGKSYTTTH